MPFARVVNLEIIYCHVFLKTSNLSMCGDSSSDTIKFNFLTLVGSFCHVLDIFFTFGPILAICGPLYLYFWHVLCFLAILELLTFFSLDSAFWHFLHFLVLLTIFFLKRKKKKCFICHMSCGTCHVSRVTCLMSHVPCHKSSITYHLSPATCH